MHSPPLFVQPVSLPRSQQTVSHPLRFFLCCGGHRCAGTQPYPWDTQSFAWLQARTARKQTTKTKRAVGIVAGKQADAAETACVARWLAVLKSRHVRGHRFLLLPFRETSATAGHVLRPTGRVKVVLFSLRCRGTCVNSKETCLRDCTRVGRSAFAAPSSVSSRHLPDLAAAFLSSVRAPAYLG